MAHPLFLGLRPRPKRFAGGQNRRADWPQAKRRRPGPWRRADRFRPAQNQIGAADKSAPGTGSTGRRRHEPGRPFAGNVKEL